MQNATLPFNGNVARNDHGLKSLPVGGMSLGWHILGE